MTAKATFRTRIKLPLQRGEGRTGADQGQNGVFESRAE
jgi:hypothetical protein